MPIVHTVYVGESIDNGGARVEAPKGLGVVAVSGASSANYEIDTYSSALPAAATIDAKYETRFTGCPPCLTP